MVSPVMKKGNAPEFAVCHGAQQHAEWPILGQQKQGFTWSYRLVISPCGAQFQKMLLCRNAR
jgi:hypothetical protein